MLDLKLTNNDKPLWLSSAAIVAIRENRDMPGIPRTNVYVTGCGAFIVDGTPEEIMSRLAETMEGK